MEDHKILSLLTERHEEALDTLRQQYGTYCLAIAYRILQNAEDAEECLNDALLRAWNHIPPDEPKSFAAYLGAITRRIALDRYRKQHRQKRERDEVTSALTELEAVFTSDSPHDVIEEAELKRLLNTFITSLPERERNILVCRYFHLYAISDIAKRYQMKENTVYVILERTLKKLKKYLEKENDI